VGAGRPRGHVTPPVSRDNFGSLGHRSGSRLGEAGQTEVRQIWLRSWGPKRGRRARSRQAGDTSARRAGQDGDHDDVVEPKRQDDSAGRGRTAGRETPRAIETFAAGEQRVPSERAESRSWRDRRLLRAGPGQMCALQGPTCFAQRPGDENARPRCGRARRGGRGAASGERGRARQARPSVELRCGRATRRLGRGRSGRRRGRS